MHSSLTSNAPHESASTTPFGVAALHSASRRPTKGHARYTQCLQCVVRTLIQYGGPLGDIVQPSSRREQCVQRIRRLTKRHEDGLFGGVGGDAEWAAEARLLARVCRHALAAVTGIARRPIHRINHALHVAVHRFLVRHAKVCAIDKCSCRVRIGTYNVAQCTSQHGM